MLRLLEIGADNRALPYIVELDGESHQKLGPPPPSTWRWIDCSCPTQSELQLLGERFGLHAAALENCANYDHRPKFEAYEEHLFIVIHAITATDETRSAVAAKELHTFVAPGYLITVHDGEIACVNQVWGRVRQEPQVARRGAVFAYYLVADSAVASVFPWVDELMERIEVLEDEMLESPGALGLPAAHQLRRLLATIRRYLAPQREVFAILSRPDLVMLGKKNGPFFRAVYDEVLRATELIESAREHIAAIRETHGSQVSQRTNDVVRRLTVLSAVFLPLTFLTGFFGQNFTGLPVSNHWVLGGVIGVCVLGPLTMLFWMKRKGWL